MAMAVTPVVIVTERLRLAPLAVEDADELSTVLGDARMYEFTGGDPPSLDQLRERIDGWWSAIPRTARSSG